MLTIPLRAVRTAAALPAGALRAATGHGLDRQVWAAGSRAMLEVRGLDRADGDRASFAAGVERALAQVEGVRSARIDPPTGRIAVHYDRGRHSLPSLVQALTTAEELVLAGLGADSAEDSFEEDLDGEFQEDLEEDLEDDAGEEAETLGAPSQDHGGGLRVTAGVAEKAAGLAAEAAERRAAHDAVDERITRLHRVGMAADVVALCLAATTRLARLPRLPPSAAALVAVVEHQPWLRRRVEGALGPARADAVLVLAGAVAHGLTRNAPALLLDVAVRHQGLRASEARHATRLARAGELRGPHRPRPATPARQDERPVAMPPGPVERLVRRSATTSLVASTAVLAATWNPDLAGRLLLVGVPKAAHTGPEAFTDSLGIGLAARGVVVTDPAALRRLDRLSCVVVQSSVLHGERPLVLDAEPCAEGWTAARVWRAAYRLLEDRSPPSPPASAPRRLEPAAEGGHRDARRVRLVEDGTVLGTVLLGAELDPLADAVLSAVREAGLRLVLTEDRGAPELAGRADEVLRDGHGDPAWLRCEVRRLQAEGDVVAVLGTDQEALAAADVGIGVVPETGAVPWAADVLCGPGLVEVPRLIVAAQAARENSRRSVRVAVSASSLGALLLAVGRPGIGGRSQLPVTMAGFGALVSATRAARAVLGRPDPVPVLHTPWHALEPAEVLARLPAPEPPGTDGNGVVAPAPPLAHAWALCVDLASNVRAELDDPLTPVLATGAAASAVIGSPVDAVLVGGVLLGSAIISGAQRMRAERALEGLLMDQRLPARVVVPHGTDRTARAAVPVTVSATRLCPGSVIALEAGDVVPADARLFEVRDLELDEATLTGESTPVAKESGATPGAELPDRTGMVYEGTTVVAGTGRAVVVAVGAATEAGRALALAGKAGAAAGMQSRLEELTRQGMPVTLLGGAAVTALGVLRGRSLRSAVASGVSVAVAAVPEGLPLMATVAQLAAARRLSARGVLVRASRTVEALGRVDTVCFDKTGTLTEGRLRLVRMAGLHGEWAPDEYSARRLLQTAGRAVSPPSGRPLAHATDRAVLEAAQDALGDDDLRWEELGEVPFHSDRGYSAAVGRTPDMLRLVLKGAPEVVLPRCSHVRDEAGKRPLDPGDRERAAAAVRGLAGQGLRVLAVARRNLGGLAGQLPPAEDIAELGDLTLLGFLGLADAPRANAARTVADLHEAGLRTVMITGDHPDTARAIAKSLGIPAEELATGPQLAALEEPARIARVAQTSVFARVSPEQKLQIIEALRQSGRSVAMVGDGANDAAAIRLADVGIGMSAAGSTSARRAADLVLTQPDVSLVIDALVEGRSMWRRVRDAVAVLLGGNLGEVAFTVAGTALAGHAPLGPRQFLVVNMFTDLLPAMALALAPTPAGPLERAALLREGPPSLGGPLLRDIGVRGAITGLSALLAWQAGRVTGTRRRASTIALAALVGAELGQTLLLSGRDPLVLATGLGSAAVLVAIIQTPVVSQFFGCTPLGPAGWTVALTATAGATLASAAVPWLSRFRPGDARWILGPGRSTLATAPAAG